MTSSFILQIIMAVVIFPAGSLKKVVDHAVSVLLDGISWTDIYVYFLGLFRVGLFAGKTETTILRLGTTYKFGACA